MSEPTFDELAAQLAAQLDRLRARYGDDITAPYQLRWGVTFAEAMHIMQARHDRIMAQLADSLITVAQQGWDFETVLREAAAALDESEPPGLIDRVRLWIWERLP